MFYLGCDLRPENDIAIATAALIVHVKKKKSWFFWYSGCVSVHSESVAGRDATLAFEQQREQAANISFWFPQFPSWIQWTEVRRNKKALIHFERGAVPVQSIDETLCHQILDPYGIWSLLCWQKSYDVR